MSGPRLVTVPLLLAGITLFGGALVPNLFLLASAFLADRQYDEQQIGIVMGSFQVAALVAFPLAGRFTQRIGYRAVLTIGCAVAAAGALAFELSTSMPGYIAGRATQGLGFGAVLVAATSYVVEIAPPRRLAQALGISGVLTLCAQAAGPALGEVVLDAAGWTWVFRSGVISGGLGAAVALLLPRAPVRAPDERRGGPSSGWVLLATGLSGVGFGVVVMFIADYARRAGAGAVSPFFVAYMVSAASARLLGGHLPDVLGHRVVAVPALVLHAIALAGMAVLGARWHLWVAGAAFGLAHGMYYPAMQAMVVERAAGARGRAVAASTFSFGFGIMAAAFGLGAVARVSGYPAIYWLAAGAGAAAAALILVSEVSERADRS